MKIIQVCTSHDQLRRGAERFCLTLTEHLDSCGESVTLVSGDPAEQVLRNYSFSYRTVPEARSRLVRKLGFDYANIPAILAFRKLVDELQPDIVHFHSFYGLSSYLIQVAARKAAVVATLHDTWCSFIDGALVTPKLGLANAHWKIPFGLLHRRINQFCFSNATLVSPSNWLIDFLSNHGSFPVPIHVPNGIKGGDCITRYENEVLWVGTLDQSKGLPSVIDDLIDVIQVSQWKLTIVGDGPLKKKLERKYNQVDFVGFSDPTEYYQRSSILLVTSVCHENFPTVVLEGMSNGLCVVGHKLAGIAEIVQHDKNGLLYESNKELVSLLKSLILQPEKIKILGSAGRKAYERDYTWEICVKNYKQIYNTLKHQN